MSRFSAWSLLAVFGIGVFLAGLELMITATALPSILLDLATTDQLGKPAFSELRHASWIVNGYLLAYVVAMPLAGRVADVWGTRRLFLVALVVFIVGSLAAGRGQSIDELILGRVIQGIGGGILVPVGTAAASHLFDGHDRPRALGIIGALTFLGMAAGPFLGAALLGGLDTAGSLERLGVAPGTALHDALAPAWRWVFYINVPIGLAALFVAWAASHGWETPRRPAGVDLVGALVWSIALAAALGATTLIGITDLGGLDPLQLGAALAVLAVVASLVTIVRGLRRPDPFLDPRLFGSVAFSSAALVSLLTGFAFATAIIGGAVFVDRVLYGGPDDQRLALGALAAATALGALVSGFAVRVLPLRLVTLAGLVLSAACLWLMSRWTPAVGIREVALVLGAFGFGFGLTVTPRSTAAVESAGRASFGMASAIVTVARMVGMAIGVAILTAYGSTTIDRLYDRLFSAANPDGWKEVIPAELRDRPLRDGLVVNALEAWAANEASGILVGMFLAAGVVTIVAIPPGLTLTRRTRMLPAEPTAAGAVGAGGTGGRDGQDELESTIAL
ncbi:MAG TPA: MFS transporter [Candidatus Limnocylindrales bacterium]|nr:MFS transporter [Candidatus Limnocylindrales bacterium]